MLFQFISAQTITLNNINSSNILEYYKQTEIKNLSQIQSVNILTQNGIGNTAETYDKTPKYLNLSQNGNFNTTYFINPNNYPTNAEIRINGSGNYIDITGTNSISDGMKVYINANDMTLFMRNY
ncbi:hypothetical protein [Kaistella yonginensis]|uniref:hypothetical protein n=1 Tax=Kaistella yonginensis TaxID=658267 RepID=UPI0025B35E0C|nr:hypothetical protein [Kaistella yonginensis]MDN3607946.1 hypothetical protein [Kaistella yonginensis]